MSRFIYNLNDLTIDVNFFITDGEELACFIQVINVIYHNVAPNIYVYLYTLQHSYMYMLLLKVLLHHSSSKQIFWWKLQFSLQVIKFVPQQEAWIIERFGKYHKTLMPVCSFCFNFTFAIHYILELGLLLENKFFIFLFAVLLGLQRWNIIMFVASQFPSYIQFQVNEHWKLRIKYYQKDIIVFFFESFSFDL